MDVRSLLSNRRPTRSEYHTQSPSHSGRTFATRKSDSIKPTASLMDSDLEEKKPPKDSSRDHGASTTTKAKHRPTIKNKVMKTPEIDAEDIPVPTPDTGLSSSQVFASPTSLSDPPTPTSLTKSPHTLGAGFSSLPSLTEPITPSGIPSDKHAPTDAAEGMSMSRALGASQSNSTGSKHLPVVAVVLVTIGVAFLFLGGIICWRIRRRPRKRSCPTPSLPILQDPFVDPEPKSDEESLFGGKERSSALARPDSNGLYNWVPYTPSKSNEAMSTDGSKADHPMSASSPSDTLSTKATMRLPIPVTAPLPTKPPPSHPPMEQMHKALTRAANRVSALSMSIYPTSPQSANTHTGIGLAIGGMSPLTADGTPVLERKPSKDRLSKSRQSFRHSLAATEYLDIYSGAQISSPSPTLPVAPTMPLKSAMRKSTSYANGRARVKAGYTPAANNAAMRASSTVAGITSLARAGDRGSVMGNPAGELQYILYPLSPALKAGDCRGDTRALTSALGLASPTPTLTPDDSITLAGDRRRARNGTHSRAYSEVMSPTTEASARLGNLMLSDFASMASLPSTRNMGGGGMGPSIVGGAGNTKRVVPRKNVNTNVRTDDRPPRVPSPPPLPSLAQMAMAHSNPEEYAEYRSPTYSIYGLYEAERKSRMQGGDF